MPRIITFEKLTEKHTACVVEAPEIASRAEPGQLVMLRFDEWPTSLPHAIADFDRNKGTVTIVVRTQVPGSAWEDTSVGSANEPSSPPGREISESAPAGDDNITMEMTGPLGRPSRIETTGKILCVAEGLGVAALFPRLRHFKENGCYTLTIAGYPCKEDIFWAERLGPHSDELYVVTDDGSFGIKGPVRHTLKAVCEHTNDIDQVFAVGSLKLLKTSAEITRNYTIPTLISLNAVFGVEDFRGAGAADTGEEAPPDFDWNETADLDGHRLDFDELTHKLGMQIAK